VTVAAGPGPVNVAGVLRKLSARTTYHVRAVATNERGSAPGADMVVTTPAFKRVVAVVTYAGSTRGKFTTIARLRVSNLNGGETATVVCAGGRRKGCRFTRKVYKSVKPGTLNLAKLFGACRRLRPGARITVQVTAPDAVGRSVVLLARSRKTPKVTRACLFPGESKPAKCPA
jgi:hypothetical protein